MSFECKSGSVGLVKKLLRAYALVALSGLTGCVISLPFRGPGYDRKAGVTLPGDESVIVVVTLASLGDNGAANSAFRQNLRGMIETMESHEGLIGWSVRRQIFGKDAWTMTVWKDEASLESFIESRIHRRAMMEGSPAMTRSRFARARFVREDIPLSWDRALKLLEEDGREG